MKIKKLQALAVICIIVGIMIAIQYRANLHSKAYISYKQWSNIKTEINNLDKQNQDLAKEIILLRNKLARDNSQRIDKELKTRLDEANILAGFTPVGGAGIIVMLDDNPDLMLEKSDINSFIIHDINLLLVINQLKAAGAEAISVNSERIVVNSEVRCAGPTILVNLNRVAPPFEIKAIGDPEKLESALLSKEGELEALRLMGIRVNMQKTNKVEIPAYNGMPNFRYSHSK